MQYIRKVTEFCRDGFYELAHCTFWFVLFVGSIWMVGKAISLL